MIICWYQHKTCIKTLILFTHTHLTEDTAQQVGVNLVHGVFIGFLAFSFFARVTGHRLAEGWFRDGISRLAGFNAVMRESRQMKDEVSWNINVERLMYLSVDGARSAFCAILHCRENNANNNSQQMILFITMQICIIALKLLCLSWVKSII